MDRIGIIREVSSLRRAVERWRAAGESIALVPTMGALHEGHMSLVEHARARGARRIVASIFVNPTQFAANEDFASYPKREADDLAALEAAGVDIAYMPDGAAMYPAGFATAIVPSGPVVADLEAAFRPGHFAGVATVVAKLLLQSLPDLAMFGEKDYQQLLVVRRIARDLDIGAEIVAVPTVRDEHGLALSSRNAYLTPAEREIARRLNAIMRGIAADPSRLGGARDALLEAGFDAVDYVEIRDWETLERPAAGRPARLLAAARIGAVRLLDNMPVAT